MIIESASPADRTRPELLRVTVWMGEPLGDASRKIAAALDEAGLTPHELFGIREPGGCQVSVVIDPGQQRDIRAVLRRLRCGEEGTRVWIGPVAREIVWSSGSLADLVPHDPGPLLRWAARSAGKRWLVTDR